MPRDGLVPGEPCENCREVEDALGVRPRRLSVVSLYRKPSLLRDWLTRYKGRPDELDVYDPSFVPIVRALLGRFLIEHGAQMEASVGGVDGIVCVPSTHRDPPHPLEAVVESLGLDVPVLRLLVRGPGDLEFRRSSKDGYVAIEATPSRLLLLDDVYTTGSRLNSAAYALAAAGHDVAVCLVLARRINPEYVPEAGQYWEERVAVPYEWATGPVVRKA